MALNEQEVLDLIPSMVAIATGWAAMYLGLIKNGVPEEAALELMKSYIRPQIPQQQQVDLNALFGKGGIT